MKTYRLLHNIQKAPKPSRAGRFGKFPRRNLVTAEQFGDARRFSGLNRVEAAELLGVSLRTIGHWETGKVRASYSAFKLLRIYRHGDLIDPKWSEFKLSRGRLVTPEGHGFDAGEMRWLSLLVRRAKLVTELVKQRDGLRAQLSLANKAVCDPAERGSQILANLAWQGIRVQYRVQKMPVWVLHSSNRGVSETERHAAEAVAGQPRLMSVQSVPTAAVNGGAP